MKTKLLIASFITALSTSFAAVAADAPAMEAGAANEKAPAAKKMVKPHSHPEANKQGAPAPEKAAGEAKKPLHDHAKEQK